MSAFDSTFPALATQLVSLFSGGTATLTRTSKTYSPSTGTTTSTTTTVNINSTMPVEYKHSLIDGTNIISGDCMIFISGESTTVPAIGDIITIASKKFTVISIKPTYSGTNVAIYEVQIRQ